MPTIEQAIAQGTEKLSTSSDSARADAQLLLAHAIGCERDWLISHAQDSLRVEQQEKFDEFCDLRATGMPVPYITGTAWFYGREFIVNDAVLIPRPETEHLIDEAVAFLRGEETIGQRRVLDVGTGSGAIACTIAAEIPNAVVDATDNAPAAIETATLNAQRLGVADRCTFYLGDLIAPIDAQGHGKDEPGYDLVVANLPYIPTAEIPSKPNPVGFEPRAALDGGATGLDLYQRLLFDLPRLLSSNALILFEAAPTVIRGLYALAQARLEDEAIAQSSQFVIGLRLSVERDYGGLERYLRASVQRERP